MKSARVSEKEEKATRGARTQKHLPNSAENKERSVFTRFPLPILLCARYKSVTLSAICYVNTQCLQNSAENE